MCYNGLMNTIVLSQIEAMLQGLPDDKLIEVKDFTAFLLAKQQKHNAFVEETLKAMQEEGSTKFQTAKEAVQAILDETGD